MSTPEQPSDPLPYCQAARFSGERPAGRAYVRAQEAIRSTDCDLSVFRMQLARVWHVAVLGQAPPENLDRSLRRTLAMGQPASLPDDIIKLLWERRAQAIQLSPWVERHRPPSRPEP